ncbi:VOC family protein [Streptomyces sp. NPDC051976]|uniref:VOC family protein n=1 Tax=Streptomyces sp. NPDC051976 TaxID=3154947 RepID=UPI0034254ABE
MRLRSDLRRRQPPYGDPYVPDVDTLTATAVTSGAELLTAPTDMPYGARQSMLRDPFGHLWIFLTPITAA